MSRQGIERGDRARLGEPEQAFGINGPLGILRRSIVCFDVRTQLSQGADLVIGETGFFAAIAGFATQCATASSSADNNSLIAQPALDDLACSGVDDKMIGIGCTRD